MGLTFRTLKEQSKMPLHKLTERTFLDAKGKVTTNEAEAFSLLGAEGDEITEEEAYRVGIRKTEPKPEETAEPKMLFYNGEGKQVKEGDESATMKFLDNDPSRPDSPERKAAETAQTAATEGKPANYNDMNKAQLVELAESRGVEPEGGQNRDHYIAALTKADAA